MVDTAVRRSSTAWAPVLGLLVLAPWMAEFSWGGMGVADLALALLFLGPLYGGAAILIRELARRTGRGWPTMLLLALAFGILQAGVVDQSLFNPTYDRFDFQEPAHVPGLGLSAYYLLAFAIGHVVASIGVPIALVEAFAARRGVQPWLGRFGLGVVAVIYVLASVVNHVGVKEEEHFQAGAGQVGVIVAAAVVLVFVAFRIRPRPRVDGRVPPPLVVGGIAAVAVVLLPGPGELARGRPRCRGRRRGGGARRPVVAAAGVGALAHLRPRGGRGARRAVTPFLGEPYDDTVSASTELMNDLVAAVIPVLLVVLAAWSLRRVEPRAVVPVGS